MIANVQIAIQYHGERSTNTTSREINAPIRNRENGE
jgi:hypothetical protein